MLLCFVPTGNSQYLLCLISSIHAEAVIQQAQHDSDALFHQEILWIDLALTLRKLNGKERVWCLKQKALAQIVIGESQKALDTLHQVQRLNDYVKVCLSKRLTVNC